MRRQSIEKRFLPDLENLEDRCTPTTSVTFSGSTVSIKDTTTGFLGFGGGSVNKVSIRDNGDGDLTIVADGKTFTGNNITKIKFDLKKKDDRISYTQTGNRTRSMTVDGSMGDGRDLFSGFIQGDINANQTLDIRVRGEDGADGIDLTANSDVDILAGATFRATLSGGDDTDRVDFNYQGEIDGLLNYHLSGDGGSDSGSGFIRATVRADLGSTGQVGQTGDTALVEGNSGDDSVANFVFKNQSDIFLAVSAKLDGGNGFLFFGGNDVGNHTANVTSVNCESDFIT